MSNNSLTNAFQEYFDNIWFDMVSHKDVATLNVNGSTTNWWKWDDVAVVLEGLIDSNTSVAWDLVLTKSPVLNDALSSAAVKTKLGLTAGQYVWCPGDVHLRRDNLTSSPCIEITSRPLTGSAPDGTYNGDGLVTNDIGSSELGLEGEVSAIKVFVKCASTTPPFGNLESGGQITFDTALVQDGTDNTDMQSFYTDLQGTGTQTGAPDYGDWNLFYTASNPDDYSHGGATETTFLDPDDLGTSAILDSNDGVKMLSIKLGINTDPTTEAGNHQNFSDLEQRDYFNKSNVIDDTSYDTEFTYVPVPGQQNPPVYLNENHPVTQVAIYRSSTFAKTAITGTLVAGDFNYVTPVKASVWSVHKDTQNGDGGDSLGFHNDWLGKESLLPIINKASITYQNGIGFIATGVLLRPLVSDDPGTAGQILALANYVPLAKGGLGAGLGEVYAATHWNKYVFTLHYGKWTDDNDDTTFTTDLSVTDDTNTRYQGESSTVSRHVPCTTGLIPVVQFGDQLKMVFGFGRRYRVEA